MLSRAAPRVVDSTTLSAALRRDPEDVVRCRCGFTARCLRLFGFRLRPRYWGRRGRELVCPMCTTEETGDGE